MAGCDIGNHRRNEQRGNPLSGGILDNFLGLLELDFKPTYTGAHIHAETEGVDIGIFTLGLESCVLHCLIGGRNTVLGEEGLFAHERLVHSVLQGVEILDLRCNVHRQHGSIEFSYSLYSADSILEVVPKRGDIIPYCRDDTKSCDYYSVFFHIK